MLEDMRRDHHVECAQSREPVAGRQRLEGETRTREVTGCELQRGCADIGADDFAAKAVGVHPVRQHTVPAPEVQDTARWQHPPPYLLDGWEPIMHCGPKGILELVVRVLPEAFVERARLA